MHLNYSTYIADEQLTHSDSTSATEHLYCAVENKQMSANCLTDTLIFLTVLLELFAICTFTDILSP